MPDLGSGLLGCYRCGYVWRLRKSPVRLCPRCKSKLWDVPRQLRRTPPRRGQGLGISEIIGPHRQALMELGAKFRASDIRVFGSVARGEAGPKSDVDLLIKFDVPQGLLARIEFKERVEALLSRRVDLATAGNLHWLIRPAVIEEAVEL